MCGIDDVNGRRVRRLDEPEMARPVMMLAELLDEIGEGYLASVITGAESGDLSIRRMGGQVRR